MSQPAFAVRSPSWPTALLAATLLLTACDGGLLGSDTDDTPAAVEVTRPAASLEMGKTMQLAAVVKNRDGDVLSNRDITWSSSDDALASVSPAGLVTGQAVGTATVVAAFESLATSVTIRVTPVPIATLAIDPPTLDLEAGEDAQLAVTAHDAAGNALPGRTVVLVSSDPAVVSVGQGGVITAVEPGSATLTATAEGRSATATVTVRPIPVASVSLSPASVSLPVGGTEHLAVVARAASGAELAGRTAEFVSSDPAVATVSAAGAVTAVAAGTATITATVEGQTATAQVMVLEPVASVAISPASISLLVGGRQQLSVVARSAAGAVLPGRSATITSSEPAVASVESGGEVLGAGVGTAVVTATVEGVSATVRVSVAAPAPVASVTVSPANTSLTAGAQQQLTVTARDAYGNVLTGRTATLTSSNPAVATVTSPGGRVTGVAAGTATITATVEGRSATAQVSVAGSVESVKTGGVTTLSLKTAQSHQLTATAHDAAGTALNRPISFASSNPAVATVSSSGLVTGVSAGTATVTATADGKAASVSVIVSAQTYVARISLSPWDLPMYEGMSRPIPATAVDYGGYSMNVPLTYSSSNPAVLRVEPNGHATAVSVGVSLVTVSGGGQTTSEEFVVSPIPTVGSVVVDPAAVSMYVGANELLIGVAYGPWGGMVWLPREWFQYSSSNPAVATVTSMGQVRGVAAGTATVTVSVLGKSTAVPVTISEIPVAASITVSPSSVTVAVDQRSNLTTTVRDASGAVIFRPITWSSSNSSVATVSLYGQVIGRAPGTTTVTATADGKSATATVTVIQGSTGGGGGDGGGSGGGGGGGGTGTVCESFNQVSAPAPGTETGWIQTQFNGLDMKLKTGSMNFGSSTAPKYQYTVVFRNRYSQQIYFSGRGPTQTKPTSTLYAKSLAAGAEGASNGEYIASPAGALWVYVTNVRFGSSSASSYCQ